MLINPSFFFLLFHLLCLGPRRSSLGPDSHALMVRIIFSPLCGLESWPWRSVRLKGSNHYFPQTKIALPCERMTHQRPPPKRVSWSQVSRILRHKQIKNLTIMYLYQWCLFFLIKTDKKVHDQNILFLVPFISLFNVQFYNCKVYIQLFL